MFLYEIASPHYEHYRPYREYPRAVARRVNNAIKKGILKRQSCETCGDPKSHAHHHNGYTPAFELDIRWLCPLHHAHAHVRWSEPHDCVELRCKPRSAPDDYWSADRINEYNREDHDPLVSEGPAALAPLTLSPQDLTH